MTESGEGREVPDFKQHQNWKKGILSAVGAKGRAQCFRDRANSVARHRSRLIRLLNNRIAHVILRVAGFSLLAAFLLLWSDFSFSLTGALGYVLMSFVVSYVIAALKIAERFPKLDRYHFVAEKDLQQSASREEWVAKQAAYLESGFRGMRIFLTPSEDGLICVPVVLLGINPVTALLGGAVFGVLHLARFTYVECIGKGVIYALACYLILPFGLLTVVAGHFITDLLALLLLKVLRRHVERRQGSGEAKLPS